MQSRKFYLTSIAPVAVALSLALINPARASETTGSAIEPQIISSSPIDAVAGSLPMSLFAPQEKEQAPDTTEAPEATPPVKQDVVDESIEPGQARAAEPVVENESTASVYSPSHLELKVPETKPVIADKTPIAALSPDESKTESTDTQPHVQLRGWESAGTPTDTPGTTGDTAQAEDSSTLRPGDIAQTVPTDTLRGLDDAPAADTRDFDLTPVSLPRRTPSFNRFEGMKYNALYFLPGRLFFSAIADSSLRLETNVFQTKNHYRPDMIFRILPNTTLGYALTRSTRVSANYFFLRDQYTKHQILDRNFHSVGFQIDQDLYSKGRTQVTAGFMGRALFTTPDQFSAQFFNDLLPSLTVTHQHGFSTVLYGSILGQIRFREMCSQFQEGDQFYSLGAVHRKGPWGFLGDFTLNNNFGNSNLRQGDNNQVIILTEEVSRRIPVPVIRLPMDVYIRCQQIFNMGANNSPGYAGVNTRVFGGVRAYLTKPIVMPVKVAGK